MPAAYFERLRRLVPEHAAATAFPRLRTLWDLDARLKLLDEFGDYAQVLSLANPPIELLGQPDATPELARMANDGLAELVHRHPERFPAFIASLPMNNIDAALREIDRAIGELGARRVQVFTNVAGPRDPQSAKISADLRPHGPARASDLGASDARAAVLRLPQRSCVARRNLVHIRLAV